MDLHPIELQSGRVLVMASNEDKLHGFFEVLEDCRVRLWEQTWHDSFRPTDVVFPGRISALRALLTGNV